MFEIFKTNTKPQQPTKTKTTQRTTTNTVTITHNKQKRTTYESNRKIVDVKEFTTEKRSQSVTEKF